MLVGSSWTVGAWKRSETKNADDPDSPSFVDHLSEFYDITNFSQPAAFNSGIYQLAKSNNPQNFDVILVCQNDVLSDFMGFRSAPFNNFAKDFVDNPITDPISASALVRDNVDNFDKLFKWLLEQFYKSLSELGKPIVLFAGPSKIDIELANKYNIKSVELDWCKLLVPTFESSYVENHMYLGWASELLLKYFPHNRQQIMEQFLMLSNQVDSRLKLYQDNQTLFSYHHPTVIGHKPMADLLNQTLRTI
jgi:hypothetical protein